MAAKPVVPDLVRNDPVKKLDGSRAVRCILKRAEFRVNGKNSATGNPMKETFVTGKESFDVHESPLGVLYLVFRSSLLTGLTFSRPNGIVSRSGERSALVKRELTEYFEGERTCFSCETSFVGGSEFERLVWDALKEVPYGQTRTYKWLAGRIGRPRAFRAVGNALGRNPIPIIFACHRIIEADGSLGGYSSGTDIKRRLIEIEYYSKQSGTASSANRTI